MELPSCPVCLDPYDLERHRPKNLPCGHSVCLQCLQNPGFSKFCPKDRKVRNVITEVSKEFIRNADPTK